MGLEVRKPQKGNRRSKFTRVSGKEGRYRVTAYLDRPTREALHMAEFHGYPQCSRLRAAGGGDARSVHV